MAHLRQAEDSDTVARVEAFNARCRSDSERVQLCREPPPPGPGDISSSGSRGSTMERLTCRGRLRLHWDVRVRLSLLESDGSKPLNRYYAYFDTQQQQLLAAAHESVANDGNDADENDERADPSAAEEVFAGVRLRRRRTKRQRQVIPVDWRRSVNGHAFTGPSCVRPVCGQSALVLADLLDRTQQVLSRLFAKYLIRDPPNQFCIVVLAPDGWELQLSDLDCPLRVRLSLGPDEAQSGKLVVREIGRPSPRTSVLELARLPTPLLRQLLASIDEEEAAEVALTRERFSRARSVMLAAVTAALDGRQTPRGEHTSHL